MQTDFQQKRTEWHAAALLLLACLVSVACSPGSLQAQGIERLGAEGAERNAGLYGEGLGMEIILTNSGFGLGGYYHHALSPSIAPFVEIQIRSGKHESEAVFSTLFGRRIIPDKRNFLMMMPVHVGIQARLFRDDIVNNFRPYVQVAAGPSLGWEYPYFNDCNANGRHDLSVDCDGDGTPEREPYYDFFSGFPRGDLRYGVGGIIAIGAFFGESDKFTQGVRIGYAFSYYNSEIQLLEDVAQHYFGSPIITYQFGRLF